MASQQYRNNSKNPFFSVEDDVDDDAFLKHPRQGSAGYMFPEHQPNRNPLEERKLQLQEERRKIEERTLDSSSRSVGLLQESERAGVETAEELIQQREQLENTERRLDDINSTLNVSQRHINNIKSVFSSLKSYFGSRGGASQPDGAASAPASASVPPPAPQGRLAQTVQSVEAAAADRPPGQHPALRLKGLDEPAVPHADDPYGRLDAQLDRNLDDMCSGLSRLRGLAEGLGTEISDQNQMLDRISTKTDRADVRVQGQNRDMQRILKK